MARPVDDAGQILFAYAQYKKGVYTGAALWRKLVEQFGDKAKTERQVRRWIEHFKELDASTSGLDDPFEWHRLEEYGLPWQSGEFLLSLWARIRSGEIFKVALVESDLELIDESQHPPIPTVRQVRWWWSVHLAVPNVEPIDVYFLAQRFVMRELERDVLATPLVVDDLEAHLAFRRWESDDLRRRYKEAIDAAYIQSLRITPHESLDDDVPGDLCCIQGNEAHAILAVLSHFPESTDLLFSYQIRQLIELGEPKKKNVESQEGTNG